MRRVSLFRTDGVEHHRRNEGRKLFDRGTERRHLTNETARCVGMLLAGDDKDRLDPRDLPIGDRELRLGGEIGRVPETANDRARADTSSEVDRETFVGLDADRSDGCFLTRRNRRPRHVGPLLHREERRLLGIVTDRHHDLVEQGAGSRQHIDVPQRDGIERPRVDRQMLRFRGMRFVLAHAGSVPPTRPD